MEHTHIETKMIGSKIAEARKKLNISQAELAKRLFISPQAVGKWERGESMPDIITLNRLTEILGVDLNYFLERVQPEINKTVIKNSGKIDPEQKDQDDTGIAHPPDRQVHINLNAVNLEKSDFAGVILHNGKFKASPLNEADFTGADLTGSTFEAINAHETSFDGANLTDCNFFISDLAGASFQKSILIRTGFNTVGLDGTKFADVKLTDVKMIMTDLQKTIFENCVFDGVDFNLCDLRGLCLDGQIFTGVKFDKSTLNGASFKGATLRNVSILPPFSVTNKSYLAMKTICFDGATIDKLTYAALKSLRVIDLSKVTVK